MKKDEIFLTEDKNALALTSTSANHISNLAKEFIANSQVFLDNMSLYDSKVSLLGSKESHVIGYGLSKEDFDTIPQLLEDISKATSLIAWLREGLKAKTRLANEIKTMTEAEYCNINNIELPIAPTMEETLTEDEYYGNLGIKERNRYYYLETQCSVIGKCIHPNGALSEAREDLQKKIQKPNSLESFGKDTIIKNYSPSVTLTEVDNVFFALQKKHRESQAALNSIKHDCEVAIKDSEIKAATKYAEAYEKYSTEHNSIIANLSKFKREETKRIGQMKIIIPDSLVAIYNKINELGK